MKRYTPKPLDTKRVKIPGRLLELTERLAENVHELWAKQRVADGWSYGPRRDDALKQHPDLVPYAELPEADKEYDRITALGTIRTILALGYRIGEPRTVKPRSRRARA